MGTVKHKIITFTNNQHKFFSPINLLLGIKQVVTDDSW